MSQDTPTKEYFRSLLYENSESALRIARNPNTPSIVLRDLACEFLGREDSILVLQAIASNPSTSIEVLYNLSKIDSPLILLGLAENESLIEFIA